MKRIVFILVLFSFFSCTKNNQDALLSKTDPENNDNILKEKDIGESEYVVTLFSNNNSSSEETYHYSPISQKIMYVTSKEGLRKRSDPTVEGNITGILIYGDRIIVDMRTDNYDTIDNIADYWYRIRYEYDGWVFGGYISEDFPSDLLIIIGLWEDEESTDIIYSFRSNNNYKKGRKDSEWFRIGKWELNGNMLTLVADENAYEKLGNQEIEEANILIINMNNILLEYKDEKIITLIRSKY
jgi:hypothetical protein